MCTCTYHRMNHTGMVLAISCKQLTLMVVVVVIRDMVCEHACRARLLKFKKKSK